MAIGIAWNLLNVVLNWIFIFGHWGSSALGIQGAGLATLLSHIAAVVFFVAYFYTLPNYRPLLVQLLHLLPNPKWLRRILALGLPIGVQFSLEAGAFAFSALMMGWLGADVQAAHQITINFASTTYMLASGIAAAATIRISKLHGEGNYTGVWLVGHITLLQVLLFMALMAAALVVGRFWFVSWFVTEPSVVILSAQLLVVAALFQLSDGAQVAGLGTLRGLGDVRFPTLIALIAYWLIGIPSGYYLGFVLHMGGVGVWYGLAIGLGLAATMLYLRFRYVVKPHIDTKKITPHTKKQNNFFFFSKANP
jgi:MATE family multidrug resistance protein